MVGRRSDYVSPRAFLLIPITAPDAADQHEVRYLELSLTTPRHGERLLEICHLDGTQLDLNLVCSRTGINLGRPWMTLLVEAFSRRLPAVFITYDEPSHRSWVMVNCIRKVSPPTRLMWRGHSLSPVQSETGRQERYYDGSDDCSGWTNQRRKYLCEVTRLGSLIPPARRLP